MTIKENLTKDKLSKPIKDLDQYLEALKKIIIKDRNTEKDTNFSSGFLGLYDSYRSFKRLLLLFQDQKNPQELILVLTHPYGDLTDLIQIKNVKNNANKIHSLNETFIMRNATQYTFKYGMGFCDVEKINRDYVYWTNDSCKQGLKIISDNTNKQPPTETNKTELFEILKSIFSDKAKYKTTSFIGLDLR
jgi:hypothetical protein